LGVKDLNVRGASDAGVNNTMCRVSSWRFDSQYAYYDNWSPIITSIDGWTGALGDDGLLYVMYSGSTSHKENAGSSGNAVYTTTYSVNGIASTNMGAVKRNGVCFDVNEEAAKRKPTLGQSLWGTVNTGIYIPSNTPVGTYTLKNLYVGFYGMAYGQTSTPTISASDTIIVKEKPHLKCIVSVPSPIDFGVINFREARNNLLAYKNGDLTINCQGDKSTKMNISFYSSDSYNTKKLGMRNSKNQVSAYIMGRLSSPLDGTCTTYDDTVHPENSGDVVFSGEASKTISVGNGQYIIPLTWSLCKNDNYQYVGIASAQATVTINWD
ncbi:TPA: hypothetical protein I8W52_004252, partial [Morganella morganii]|nr:hypothetical protein [Morganella morganii]